MPPNHPPRLAPTRVERPTPPTQAGQATLEYAGLLAVVVVVLVVTTGVAGGGGILNGVLRGFERALCRVTGGDCLASELQACTVRSRETGGRFQVKVTFVKLGRSLSVLREQLSDGTVDVTLIDGADVAPTAAIGASAGLQLGGDRLGGGVMAQAEWLVRLGRRRVWHRPDVASADRLVENIAEHVAANAAEKLVLGVGSVVRRLAHEVGYDGDVLPAPDVDSLSGGADGLAEAGIGTVAQVKAGLRTSLGGTYDRETRRRTLVFSLEGDASAALSKAAGGATLKGSRGATVSVVFDREGDPLELSVAVAGAGGGDLALGLPGHKVAGERAGRVETTSRLDLTRSANRAVFDGLFAALAPDGRAALPGAVAALARQLESSSRRDVMRYATDKESYGADGELAVVARAGGSAELSLSSSALEDAWTRPAGGAWERRTDCVDPDRKA